MLRYFILMVVLLLDPAGVPPLSVPAPCHRDHAEICRSTRLLSLASVVDNRTRRKSDENDASYPEPPCSTRVRPNTAGVALMAIR
jgi:hypothetical protein